MDQVWRFNVDYTKVAILATSMISITSTVPVLTASNAKIQRWLCGAKLQCHRFNKQFQVFSEQNTSSYSAEPQLTLITTRMMLVRLIRVFTARRALC